MNNNSEACRSTLLKGCWLRNKEEIIATCAPRIQSLIESMPDLQNHPQLDRIHASLEKPREAVVLLVEECVIKEDLWDVFFRGLTAVELVEVRACFEQVLAKELELIQKRVEHLQGKYDGIRQQACEELDNVQPMLEEARRSVQGSMYS